MRMGTFFALLVKTWFETLVGEVKEKVKHKEDLESKPPATQTTTTFGM